MTLFSFWFCWATSSINEILNQPTCKFFVEIWGFRSAACHIERHEWYLQRMDYHGPAFTSFNLLSYKSKSTEICLFETPSSFRTRAAKFPHPRIWEQGFKWWKQRRKLNNQWTWDCIFFKCFWVEKYATMSTKEACFRHIWMLHACSLFLSWTIWSTAIKSLILTQQA